MAITDFNRGDQVLSKLFNGPIMTVLAVEGLKVRCAVHPDPEPKGAPRSIRSASVPPVSDVATVEGVPDLATGKNRSVT